MPGVKLPDGVTIVGIDERVTTDSGLKAVRVMRVVYRVKDQGPFYLDMPSADFTAQKAADAVSAKATEVLALF